MGKVWPLRRPVPFRVLDLASATVLLVVNLWHLRGLCRTGRIQRASRLQATLDRARPANGWCTASGGTEAPQPSMKGHRVGAIQRAACEFLQLLRHRVGISAETRDTDFTAAIG